MKRIAKVVDNKDPDKMGKVKVQVLPELDGINEDALPWANPVHFYNMIYYYEQKIPKKDDYIIVDVNDTWTTFSYNNMYPYSENKDIVESIYNILNEVSDLQSKKDGTQPYYLNYNKDNSERLFFEDSETGEMGIIFPNKRFTWFTGKDGKQIIYGDKNNKYLELNEDGSFKIKVVVNGTEKISIECANDGKVEIKNSEKNSSVNIENDGNINISCQGTTEIAMTDQYVLINNHFKVTP